MAKFTYPEDNEISELNKCPECGSFFSTLYCPICGAYCPEEMRAGNRKKQKPVVDRRSVKGATNTPFYLRWWFILILALFNLTLPAIILTCMTDWKVWVKVIVVFALLLPIILSIFIYPLIKPFLFDYLEKYYGDMYPSDGYPQDQITENASQNQYVDFDCFYEIRCDLL